jgi:hypothetical protein
VVYEDDPDTRVWVVDGLTTDDNLVRLYQHAVDVHTDAWMLKRAEMLPDWWRLVREVRIDNLRDETPHYRVAHPLGEAAIRLTGLTPVEISHTVAGWRVQRTRQPGEGRIVKVKERRTTGTMKQGRPDMRIRHREAFAPTREQARVDIPPPEITFEGFDINVSRVRVQVVGPYTLLPQERVAA